MQSNAGKIEKTLRCTVISDGEGLAAYVSIVDYLYAGSKVPLLMLCAACRKNFPSGRAGSPLADALELAVV
ncbi:hypothetical protein ACFQ88_27560 [Paenibacillus sp. NPDC056579]|uniref:hypothetical protein n=1 Tax=Paenibacillus sp. NPDC056579 TaxID=3345871 RepID=UPI0036ABFFC5